MSARQPGNPSLAFFNLEKPFLFSDLAVKAAKSENKKKAFQPPNQKLKRLFNYREGSD